MNARRSALFFVTAVSIAACARRAADSPRPRAPGAPPRVAPAASCALVRAARPEATDGEYLLTVGDRQASIYCHHMATSPTEYLTLLQTAEGQNVSTYGAGPNSSGLTTRFAKVRFHPGALTLDPSDTTFATSTGSKSFGAETLRANDYGDAGDCRGERSTTGAANVDLRGTPFAVARGQFSPQGWQPAGAAVYASADQVVDLTGGGFCGDNKVANGRIALGWLGAPPATTVTPDARVALDAGAAPRVEGTASIEAACSGYGLTRACMDALSVRSPCPATFVGAGGAGYCGGDAECTYPEGLCRCAPTSYCGGAAPTALQEHGRRWTCRPPHTAGECPESPSDGARCASNGQKCSYDTCTSATACECKSGTFRCATRRWSPAP